MLGGDMSGLGLKIKNWRFSNFNLSAPGETSVVKALKTIITEISFCARGLLQALRSLFVDLQFRFHRAPSYLILCDLRSREYACV